MKNLRHPNIVQLYEMFEDQKYIYLVMEFVEGKSLFDWFAEKENLSEPEAAKVTK